MSLAEVVEQFPLGEAAGCIFWLIEHLRDSVDPQS